MPWMNFDLEDGNPPVGFSLKLEDAERFVAFMDECQRIKESANAAPVETKPDYVLRAYVADLIHCSELVIRNGEPISPADRKIALSRIDSIRAILADAPAPQDHTDDRNWQLREGDPFAPRSDKEE
jgi:hypothetical protein